MAGKKRTGGDDAAWSGQAIGGDDKPPRPPGAGDQGRISRIGEHFWREMDTVPLSTPRWNSRAKMNANIKWLLSQAPAGTERSEEQSYENRYSEDVVKASFAFFRQEVDSIAWPSGESCWDVYFRQRGRYLRAAQRVFEGSRPGEAVRKAGDIHVDNDRYRPRQIGDPVDNSE